MIEFLFKQCLFLYFAKSMFRNYSSFIQNTLVVSKIYNMQIYNSIYRDLQLARIQRITISKFTT